MFLLKLPVLVHFDRQYSITLEIPFLHLEASSQLFSRPADVQPCGWLLWTQTDPQSSSSASGRIYILFTQEISTRVTSCQHGSSDLNKRYFQLDISWEPCGLQRSGLCWEVAESIVFRTNFVRNIQCEALGFNNGKYQTPPKCEAAIWLQKLLQTPSSQQVWTVCAHICLVDGWKASQVWFGLCL